MERAPLAGPAMLLALSAGCSEYQYIKQAGDDVFYQLDAGAVDVLLVVDNSGSMQPYQEKLSTNFDQFLTYFIEGDVDYHIGVVTTTVGEAQPYGSCTEDDVAAIPPGGELVEGTYIGADTPDASEVFSRLVQVGTCGSGYEMGLESAYLAVTEPLVSGANAGFIRDEAYFSIIFVSDEQDSSPLPVADYINAFRDVKGQRNRDIFNASALVVSDTDACTAAQVASGADEGTRYVDVAQQTGGVLGNICADDFGDIVTELSLASSRLTDTFYLSKMPAPATLVVGVNGEEVPCDTGEWTFQKGEKDGEEVGMIVFDRAHLPPPRSKITARYDLGTGDESEFCTGEGA